jgi:hypothetical protein
MRWIAAIAMLGALAACTTGRFDPRRDLKPTAEPSAVIATEIAFARAAREKGQWTAFREFAAEDAVMFVPEPVIARDWLRRQTDPAQAVQWQPHQVWSSCDGSLAVTRGAWQRPDGSVGYFTTVWERQDNREYRWVMDQGDVLAEPLSAPELIEAKVADCRSEPFTPLTVRAVSTTIHKGTADDGTLEWSVAARPDGSRTVVARYWDGSEWQFAVQEQVAAQ